MKKCCFFSEIVEIIKIDSKSRFRRRFRSKISDFESKSMKFGPSKTPLRGEKPPCLRKNPRVWENRFFSTFLGSRKPPAQLSVPEKTPVFEKVVYMKQGGFRGYDIWRFRVLFGTPTAVPGVFVTSIIPCFFQKRENPRHSRGKKSKKTENIDF